jgi:acetylglutamate kinase
MTARGQVTVVKLGGRTQADAALPAALAALWHATGHRLVIVHGGGDAVSELQRARGLTPAFVGGRRVTTDADIEIIRMALSGLANKQLVGALQAGCRRSASPARTARCSARRRPPTRGWVAWASRRA